jgi:hypothetical protein
MVDSLEQSSPEIGTGFLALDLINLIVDQLIKIIYKHLKSVV